MSSIFKVFNDTILLDESIYKVRIPFDMDQTKDGILKIVINMIFNKNSPTNELKYYTFHVQITIDGETTVNSKYSYSNDTLMGFKQILTEPYYRISQKVLDFVYMTIFEYDIAFRGMFEKRLK